MELNFEKIKADAYRSALNVKVSSEWGKLQRLMVYPQGGGTS